MKMTKIFIVTAFSASLAILAFAGPRTPELKSTPSVEHETLPVGITYPTTIVELFTSQGCSSCPPANGFVRDLGVSDELLTLSFSVDYWDYLGWKDTLGKSEFSARQREYGHQFQGQVYTPQIVLNGKTHAARFAKSDVRKQNLPQDRTTLKVDVIDGRAHIKGRGNPGEIIAVTYKPGVEAVDVGKGENRGRTIKLANVVTACAKLGTWQRNGEFSRTVDLPTEGEALAILVQDGMGGPILAAANYLP